jgi:mono/diheme cytochrome c family protein
MARNLLIATSETLAFLILLLQPSPVHPRQKTKGKITNPLEVLVDERGTIARVMLTNCQTIAVVDLEKGSVKKELPLAGWKPQQVPIHGPKSSRLKRFLVRHQPHELLNWYGQTFDSLENITLRTACAVTGKSLAKEFKKREVDLLVLRYPKTQLSTTQVAQGWTFSTLIVFWRGPLPYTATLDEPQRAFADASDIVLTSDGRRAFLSFAGADVVLAIDVVKLLSYQQARFRYALDQKASRHFVIAKLPSQANPRRLGLCGDGRILVASNYLSDSLTVIDAVNLKVLRHISLSQAKPDAARRGEILFNSAKMTFHGQFTCASCHPNGGSDGLTWDLTRDGIGNFKKTKSLLGVKDTAPYGWHGSSRTLADRVAGTLRTLHRHEPAGTEVEDIVAYLKTLPPPRLLPPKEADKPAIARGKALFQGKGQCANCHHRAALDDGKLHDIGTRGPTDTQDRFDTPALLGVARTPTYLHDGRAKTLAEIFTKHNAKQRHGAAHKLTKEELAELIAYLKSL